MEKAKRSALDMTHRLLFRALVEIRAQGHEDNNTLVFHLADLFHQVVLEMKNAAEGKITYEQVFRLLESRAKEKGCEKWLFAALSDVEAAAPVALGSDFSCQEIPS